MTRQPIRPETSALPEASELLLSLQLTFDWTQHDDSFELASAWERPRTGSRFFRYDGSPSGAGVVIKTQESWEGNDARLAYESLADLHAIVTKAGIDHARTLTPLGWTARPPIVVTPYVDGDDLVSMIRQPNHRMWNDDHELLRKWLDTAGAIVSAYHVANRCTDADQQSNALSDTRATARRLGVRKGRISQLLQTIDPETQCATAFEDLGPGNLFVSTDERVYLLDPPTQTLPRLVHRDIGNFLFELRRQLAGRGFTPAPPARPEFDELRDAFIERYDSSFSAADRALVALFEARRAAGMARKRFPRRLGDSVWFARLARERRAAITADDLART